MCRKFTVDNKFYHTKIKRYKLLYLFLFIYTLSGTFFPFTIYAQVDPGVWETIVSSNNSNPTARHENAYVKSGNKFYLLGSRGTKKVEIYDPAAKLWTQGANVPIEMHHFQAVDFNNMIYVVCGFTGGYPTETPLANIYIYNPASDRWTTGPEIPSDRRRGSAGVVVYNNKIYIISGITNGHTSGHVKWFDEFDPASGIWTTLTDAPHARDHYHAALSGNKIVLAGGRNSSYPNTFELTVAEVDVYNFSTGSWTTMANNIPTPRAGASVAVLGDEVIVIGGESIAQFDAHQETEALNIISGSWRSLAMLNEGRHGTQAIVHNNTIYIAAGSKTRGGNGSTELGSQELFTISIDTTTNDTVVIKGTNKAGKLINVSFYPNPCNDKITLNFNEENKNLLYLKIFTDAGNAIKEFTISPNEDIQIDMSGYSEGIYLINIKGDNEKINQSIKIVKK